MDRPRFPSKRNRASFTISETIDTNHRSRFPNKRNRFWPWVPFPGQSKSRFGQEFQISEIAHKPRFPNMRNHFPPDGSVFRPCETFRGQWFHFPAKRNAPLPMGTEKEPAYRKKTSITNKKTLITANNINIKSGEDSY